MKVCLLVVLFCNGITFSQRYKKDYYLHQKNSEKEYYLYFPITINLLLESTDHILQKINISNDIT